MNSTNQHAQRPSPAPESSGSLKKYYLVSRDFLRSKFLPKTLFRSWFLRWKHTEYRPKVPSSWEKILRWKRGKCLQSREDFTSANTGFTTRRKQGQIRLCQKKNLKKPDHFWKSILRTAEIKINLYQNDRKKKVLRRLGTTHDPKHTTSAVKHGGAV